MADHHEAQLEVSGCLESDLWIGTTGSPQRETRAAKRARINGGMVALAPQSLPPSLPSQAVETHLPRSKYSSQPPQAFGAPIARSLVLSTPPSATGGIHFKHFNVEDTQPSSIDTPQADLEFDGQSKDSQVQNTVQSTKLDRTLRFHTVQRRIQNQRGKKQAKGEDEFSPDDDTPDAVDEVFELGKLASKSHIAGKCTVALRKTSVKPYYASNQDGKLESHGQPCIWADKRQQLCETLPYYRAYEGSAYTNLGTVYGVLIDKEVEARDRFDDEVIITSVGGGRSTNEDGKRGRQHDQPRRKAEPFIKNMQQRLPIVVIAGQGNIMSPSKLPHVYNVLDWFHVTDVWPEKSGDKGLIAWRIRLEKVHLSEKSWWAVKGFPAMPQDSSNERPKADVQTCADCGSASKVRYNAGWACLEVGCKSFFKFKYGYDDATLDYDGQYMQERSVYRGLPPGPLNRPPPSKHGIADAEIYGFEKILKRGMICPRCGCCSRRIAWDHWYCENLDCDFTYIFKQRTITLHDVLSKAMDYFEANKSPGSTKSLVEEMDKEFAIGGVLVTHSFHGPWNINEYAIPNDIGKIIGWVRHFRSSGIINQQKDGPNDLFQQIQSGEFGLRRNAARQAGSVGEMLTSHFAANFGAPYKFGVKQVSKGFNQAPEVILKTIKRLSWAGQLTVADKHESFQPFNECLTIGYFEGSVINYHDDGEKTLGPTVATLSLGAPARMMFRPKAKNAIGKLVGKGKYKAPVLQITLEHGDIVIMHGELIQKLYEHSVTPWGFRFALTCRSIMVDKMDLEEERQAAILEGTLPPESKRYTYDGDLGATEVTQPIAEFDKIVNDIAVRLKTGDIKASQVSELKEKLASLLASSHTELGQSFAQDQREIVMPHGH